MVIVMVRIPVGSDEQAETMVGRFRQRAGLVDSQPGFVGFELLRAEGELISMTRWDTREDLDRWMSSESNRQAHSAGGPGGGASVTVYEVVIPGAAGS